MFFCFSGGKPVPLNLHGMKLHEFAFLPHAQATDQFHPQDHMPKQREERTGCGHLLTTPLSYTHWFLFCVLLERRDGFEANSDDPTPILTIHDHHSSLIRECQALLRATSFDLGSEGPNSQIRRDPGVSAVSVSFLCDAMGRF